MDLRKLEYFRIVAQEENITKAANILHISQPALSKQLKELEDEIGKKVLIRGNRGIRLTEEGYILLKRTEEILDLLSKTERELKFEDKNFKGEIFIGAGETAKIKYLIYAYKVLREKYRNIELHIRSGNTKNVLEQLERGTMDFGLILKDPKKRKLYNAIDLPEKEIWGILVHKNHPLSKKNMVKLEDIVEEPLIVSEEFASSSIFRQLEEFSNNKLKIVGTYNLIYNASKMVEQELGVAICLEEIINTSDTLVFVPLEIDQNYKMMLIWKKDGILSKAAQLFLDVYKEIYT